MRAGSGSDSVGPRDIYFEFTRIGGQVRVAAIDSRTGTEVVVIAPVTATQVQMRNLALAKLRRRLATEP